MKNPKIHKPDNSGTNWLPNDSTMSMCGALMLRRGFKARWNQRWDKVTCKRCLQFRPVKK